MNYLCCVCDNRASKDSKFCKDCVVIYTEVENEPWFLDLCKLMTRQRTIDNIEKYPLYRSNTQAMLPLKSKVSSGRPRTSFIIRELVKRLKDDNKSLTIRSIEDICKNSKINVSRETIRRILNELE